MTEVPTEPGTFDALGDKLIAASLTPAERALLSHALTIAAHVADPAEEDGRAEQTAGHVAALREQFEVAFVPGNPSAMIMLATKIGNE